ncbi:MAG: tetratricopeptide repeat protein, partial [Pseudomonadota bacterium]
NNPLVTGGFTRENVRSVFLDFRQSDYWNPGTTLSHMAAWSLFGADPAAHHLVNVALHAASAMLLFLALWYMTGAMGAAFLVAALFVAHPVNVEGVAWIAERKNVLSQFFFSAALLAWALYAERRSPARYAAVFTAMALGVMSKQIVMLLPFCLVLLDVWPLGRARDPEAPLGLRISSLPGLLAEKIPLFGLTVFSVAMGYLSTRSYVSDYAGQALLDGRVQNALMAPARYLGKIFWPVNLAAYYPYVQHPATWKLVGAALFIATATALALWQARKRPCLAVGWFWFAGCLVPVAGLVQPGLWPAMADRFAYLPQIGVFCAVVFFVRERVGDGKARWAAAALCLGLAVFLGVKAHAQVGVWKNDASLFAHAASVTQGNAVAENALGMALKKEGRLPEALAAFGRSLEAQPGYFKALTNKAITLAQLGRHQEALEFFRSAARKGDPNSLTNLGRSLAAMGRFPEAVDLYERVLADYPAFADARVNLAMALAAAGRVPEAQAQLKRVLDDHPGHPQASRLLEKLRVHQEKGLEGSPL